MSPETIPLLNRALDGRYRLEVEVGAGGMATVYVAEDLRHERKVALKVLRPDLATAVGAERFHKEILTTARLQHPHIVPLFDSGEAGGHLFFVMPLVEGESLRARLEREGPLPVDDAILIAEQCAGALEYAHGRGVVHRDLKPANILLTGEHAVVADFGIAAVVSAPVGKDGLTGTGVSIGTVGYMSPEQVSGAGAPVDGRADQYALGCVLYEMLTGERLFRGATAQAVLARQLDGAGPASTVRPTVPSALDAVIRKACQPTPGDRYKDARSFATALKRAKGGNDAAMQGKGPASAPIDETRVREEPAGEPGRPGPSGALSGRSGSTTPAARPSGPSPRKDERSSRRYVPRMIGVAALGLVLATVAWGLSRLRPGPEGPLSNGVAGDRVVAVLPFEELNPSSDHPHFATGMHQDVIAQLATVRALTVLPRQAVNGYRGSFALDSVAADLQANYLLTATIQRSSDQIRLTLELIESDGLGVVWSEQYDRQLTAESLFEVQSGIARNAAEALAVSLSPEEERRLATPPTRSLVALDLYTAGRGIYESNTRDDEGFEVAIRQFRAALDADPGFAPAWAGLADVFAQRVCCESYPIEWADTALVYARRAYDLDRELVRAHQSMAKAHGQFERRDSTIAWYESALALNSNDGQSLNNISLELRLAGALPEATEYALRSTSALPTHPNPPLNVSDAYAVLGFDEAARAWHARAEALGRLRPGPLELMWADPLPSVQLWTARLPDEPGTSDNPTASIGILHYLAGSFQPAIEAIEESMRMSPNDEARREAHHPTTVHGLALWLTGDTVGAQRSFEIAEERIRERFTRGGTHWQYAFDLASIQAVRGEVDEAFEMLDQAYEWGFRHRSLAFGDPALESIRSDPRFQIWFNRIEEDLRAQRATVVPVEG